jgi:hypothetical protein
VLEVTNGEVFRESVIVSKKEHREILLQMETAAKTDKFRKKTLRPFQQNTGKAYFSLPAFGTFTLALSSMQCRIRVALWLCSSKQLKLDCNVLGIFSSHSFCAQKSIKAHESICVTLII